MTRAKREQMRRAICWEMTANSRGIEGFRVLVADRYVCTQFLEQGNDRPRWSIEETSDMGAAMARAQAVTDHLDSEYGAVLSVEPSEIVLHDSEVRALRPDGRIPPALRARAYTTFHRLRGRLVAE